MCFPPTSAGLVRPSFASSPHISMHLPPSLRLLRPKPSLASSPPPDYYTACNPDDLHAPTRLKRVLARLAREVDAGAVVCLQEVSISWAGPLHTFFQSRGYSLVSHLYSAACLPHP